MPEGAPAAHSAPDTIPVTEAELRMHEFAAMVCAPKDIVPLKLALIAVPLAPMVTAPSLILSRSVNVALLPPVPDGAVKKMLSALVNPPSCSTLANPVALYLSVGPSK